jgi:hypothetical protein
LIKKITGNVHYSQVIIPANLLISGLRFSQRCSRRFKSCGTWRPVDWCIVTDVSEELLASIVRIVQKWEIFECAEDEGCYETL